MSNSDNPYAQTSGSQMTGTVSYGDAPAQETAQPAAADVSTGDMLIGGGAGTTQTNGPLISDTTTANFTRDVIEGSKSQPVLVDFWAPWCGPCKQLGPIIEKAVTAAAGKVKLVKLNIDDHPAIPGQMGIKSIPAVVAFVDGQPVDGFMGAVPESQVSTFIDKVAAMKGDDNAEQKEQIAALMEQAKVAFDDRRTDAAAQIYTAILGADQSHPGALGGLASCLIASNALDEADQLLGSLPDDVKTKPEVVAAIRQLEQIREVASLGNPVELEAKIAADGNDFESRLALAKILNVQGERQKASEQLFAIMRKELGWNDDAARKQLIAFFETWGPTDPATSSARRQLSSLLFS